MHINTKYNTPIVNKKNWKTISILNSEHVYFSACKVDVMVRQALLFCITVILYIIITEKTFTWHQLELPLHVLWS